MKTIEQLEKEYEEFQTKTDTSILSNIEEFYTFLRLAIMEMEENEKLCKKEIRLDKLAIIKGKAICFALLSNPDEELMDNIKQDIKALEDTIEMGAQSAEYIADISEIVTEDNYLDFLKLVEFICKAYTDHIDYYESERQGLEMQLKGFSFFDGRFENYMPVFMEFMNKKLETMKKEKAVQKIKQNQTPNNMEN